MRGRFKFTEDLKKIEDNFPFLLGLRALLVSKAKKLCFIRYLKLGSIILDMNLKN